MRKQCISLLLVLTAFLSHGQYAIGDLDLDGDIATWYDQTNGIEQHPVYEGPFYRILNPSILSHQYFGENNWSRGFIEFDGNHYEGIDMLYNIYEDVLIVRNPNSSNPSTQSIKINQERIRSFSFQNSFFRYLKPAQSGFSSGLYQIIYEGENTSAVAKRMKASKVVDTGFIKGLQYYTRSRYYLQRTGRYVPYRGKKSFYDLFPEFKQEIKAHIKEKRIVIGKENEDSMKQLLIYCEELLGR